MQTAAYHCWFSISARVHRSVESELWGCSKSRGDTHNQLDSLLDGAPDRGCPLVDGYQKQAEIPTFIINQQYNFSKQPCIWYFFLIALDLISTEVCGDLKCFSPQYVLDNIPHDSNLPCVDIKKPKWTLKKPHQLILATLWDPKCGKETVFYPVTLFSSKN